MYISPPMFAALFLTACAGYALLDLQLVRGLRRLRGGSDKAPPPSSDSGDEPSITVLVAARDEEHNLPRTLDRLLAQDWPADRLQIVVIDDRSTDATPAILRDYAARFPGRLESVRVDEAPPGISPKKNALMHGLRRARGTWIVVTDADCVMGPRWITGLMRHATPDTGMIVGVTAYIEPHGGFGPAEGARALEFVSYGITAAGLMALGLPVTANANNLAYRRLAFDEAGGFARHEGIVSGDDDFTLQEIHATGRWRIRTCVDSDAQVRTEAPPDWGMFWEQRKRWAGKCLHYRPPQIAFLALIIAFYGTIAGLLVAGLFPAGTGLPGVLGLTGFAVKTAADFVVMREGLTVFGLTPLLRFFPLTAALHIPLMLAAAVVGPLGRFTWKGQRLARKA